jgi:(p)ppGpp synthase/HD superfamily hydrolase
MSNQETLSPRMIEALELAIKLHGHDTRKKCKVPYLAHVLNVCALVIQDGGDEDEAVAALLHDALEDKPEEINEEDINASFGRKVADIVRLCSDTERDFKGGEKGPWRERKERYLNEVKQHDPALLRVTVADKIDNARAIIFDHKHVGDAIWTHFKAGKEDQIWYYSEAMRVYREVGFSGPLLEELDALVEELKLIAGVTWPPDGA